MERSFFHRVIALVATVFVLVAHAAPGQLDNSFGSLGIVSNPIGPSGARPVAVAVLPDGKVLVGGNSLYNTQGVVTFPIPQFIVTRFNADGSLDTTFGDEGSTRPTAFASRGDAYAMAVQPDGTIVVAGSAGPFNNSVMAVARYDPDGALDPAFGERTVTFPVGQSAANGVAVQPDGKILLGGYVESGSNPFFALARLNVDGSLDTTFNGTGRLAFAIGTSSVVRSVVLQPDGKIVLAGYADLASFDFAIARVNANGTLDTSFGCATPGTCTGFATLDFVGGNSEFGEAAALLPDGRIVVAGSYSVNGFGCGIARFNANGTLDNTFGFLGRATAASSDSCDSVVVQPDQKLLLRSGGLLIRRHANGIEDATFGTSNGTALGLAGGTGLALSGGGEIVIAGQRSYAVSENLTQEALVVKRFLSSGAPDPAFAGGSAAEVRFELGALLGWNAVSVQPDGRIVAAGYAIGEQELQRAGIIARFLPGGALDVSFGQGKGWVLTPTAMEIEAVDLQADGRIVVTGNRSSPAPKIVVHRFLPDGSLDTEFNGRQGRYEIENGTGGNANAMLVTPDEFIALAGSTTTGGGDFLFGRVRDGNAPSLVQTDMGDTDDVANAIARRPDGRFVLAGRSGPSMAVLGLTSSGGIDATFNGNGKIGIPFGTSATARAIAVAPDNKIVVAGTTFTASSIVAVARLTTVGALDTTFNGTGKVTTDIPVSTSDQVGAVLVQADGKILVGGASGNAFIVVRYNASGTLDTSFAGNGILTVPVGNGADLASMAFQPDGRLVLAGSFAGARPVPVLMRVLLEPTPSFPGFASVFNAALSVDVTSNTSAPTNFTGTIPISIVNGSYSINCAPAGFTTLPANITSGTQLCVRHRTSSLPGDTVTSTLYLGTSNATFSSTTGKASAIVGLSSSANPASIEAPVTFTATVIGQFGTPSGLVTFRDGSIVLGVASVGAFGIAQMTTSSLVVGSHAISATYAGNATYNLAAGSLTQAVSGSAVAVSVATPITTVTYGAAVSFNATLSPPPGDGTLVVFKANNNAIGVATVSGATASFQTRALPVGVHSITASFVPSGLFGAATSLALVVTVNAAASSTVVESSGASVALGTPVVFTSQVAGPGFEFGGTVAFRDGATAIPGCTAVPLVNQRATCSTTALGNGTHSITAAYSGDGNNLASTSGALLQEITLDAAGDLDQDGIPNGVELTELRNPLVKDNDIFGNARLFAMQQYRDFLGREGDAAGITSWVNYLGGGGTRAAVTEGFFGSPEFQGTGSPVVRLYFAYFLRIPDYAGLTFWMNYYRTGHPLVEISNAFAGSQEFVDRYGALSNSAFVDLVYQNVLGRAPDAGGKAFWLGQLNGGTTRGEMMIGFSESAEYQSTIFSETYVTMMYVGMLKREPDVGGFNFWVGYLDAGNSGQALINGFLVAPEYHNRFLP